MFQGRAPSATHLLTLAGREGFKAQRSFMLTGETHFPSKGCAWSLWARKKQKSCPSASQVFPRESKFQMSTSPDHIRPLREPVTLHAKLWDDDQWLQHFVCTRPLFRNCVRSSAQHCDTKMRPALTVEKRAVIAVWKLATPDCYRNKGQEDIFVVDSSFTRHCDN
ncbi:uncharacterized protein [Lepidochelys kempii]|uniref:uncharacterized protein isoform X2 n=1 Tax=Lepidochelys kempii TaxID=8472 RepID=UPI003C6FA4DE